MRRPSQTVTAISSPAAALTKHASLDAMSLGLIETEAAHAAL